MAALLSEHWPGQKLVAYNAFGRGIAGSYVFRQRAVDAGQYLRPK